MSEGHKSAQAILNGYMVLPRPTTELELELQDKQESEEAQRVRRVLAPSGCTHDCNQGRNCTCRPATQATERKPGLWKSWRW